MDWVRNIPADQWGLLALALSAPVILTLITVMVTGKERTAMGIAILLGAVLLAVFLKARG